MTPAPEFPVRPLTVSFGTFGCRVNTADTQRLEREAVARGLTVLAVGCVGDIHVVNTCTVTSKADDHCLRHLRGARRQNPRALIVLVGCLVQARRAACAAIDFGDADLVLDNADKERLFDVIAAHVELCPRATATPARSGRRRAFVKAQDGCDRSCAYCIVPRARGPSQSRTVPDVVTEVRTRIVEGYREIVLVGVHLGCFGLERTPHGELAALLRVLTELDGDYRLRLSSLEPDEIDDELTDALSHPRICRHLHLPIQSGSAKVLAAMGRRYQPACVDSRIAKLTQALPNLAVGADFIVGFPGESDQDFAETLAMVRRLPLSYLHVFAYSPRPLTRAAGLPEQLPREAKEERLRLLRKEGATKRSEFERLHLGGVHEAWIYRRVRKSGRVVLGLTSNYLKVRLADADDFVDALAPILVTHLEDGELCGRLQVARV
jgi:threonylcarbamoyladenosine tRNA methylthiotransferase MtaB